MTDNSGFEPPPPGGYEPPAPPHQPPYQPPPQQPGYQQQGYQQQPGVPAPPSQPPLGVNKPKRAWWKIALVIIGLGILLIGGCTMLVVRAVSGPIDAANEFLADLADQNFEAAIEHLDPACFSGGVSADVLESQFGRGLVSYNLTSVSNDNNSVGTASGTISRSNFGVQPIDFAMTKPGDAWLVCGVSFGDG
jgi:hypothetical protein